MFNILDISFSLQRLYIITRDTHYSKSFIISPKISHLVSNKKINPLKSLSRPFENLKIKRIAFAIKSNIGTYVKYLFRFLFDRTLQIYMPRILKNLPSERTCFFVIFTIFIVGYCPYKTVI